MKTFKVKTEKNLINVGYCFGFINKKDIVVKKEIFSEMCEKGCRNYNKKFSCPPCSPDFNKIQQDKEGLFVVLFKIDLNQINSTEYNKIRIANSVMKSRIDKIMRKTEEKFNTKYLSTGSCRLCKICKKVKGEICRHPEKMRYGMEATGIDCDEISRKLFSIPLTWYKNKKCPEYSCVMCGLFCNASDFEKMKNEVEREMEDLNNVWA